jgi:hypothetical protein
MTWAKRLIKRLRSVFKRSKPAWGSPSYVPVGQAIKITFEDEDGKRQLGTAYGLGFSAGPSGITGTMTELAFDTDPFGALRGKTGRLRATITYEPGKVWTYFDQKVQFYSFDSAVTLDHVVIEGVYGFTVIKGDK